MYYNESTFNVQIEKERPKRTPQSLLHFFFVLREYCSGYCDGSAIYGL